MALEFRPYPLQTQAQPSNPELLGQQVGALNKTLGDIGTQAVDWRQQQFKNNLAAQENQRKQQEFNIQTYGDPNGPTPAAGIGNSSGVPTDRTPIVSNPIPAQAQSVATGKPIMGSYQGNQGMGYGLAGGPSNSLPSFSDTSPFQRQKMLADFQASSQIQTGQRQLATQQMVDDPTSTVSKVRQALAKKFFPEIDFSGVPASQLTDIDKLGESYAIGGYKQQFAQDKFNTDTAAKFGAAVSGNEKMRNTMATNQQKLNLIGSAKAAFDQMAAQGGANSQQVLEAGITTLRSLIGNNMLTEGELNRFLPNTYRGRVADFLQKLTNQPQSQEAQDFISRYGDTLRREFDITNGQMTDARNQMLGEYKTWAEKNPQYSTPVLKSYNIYHPLLNPMPTQAQNPFGTGGQMSGGPSPQGVSSQQSSGNTTRIQASDGSLHDIPTVNVQKAKQRDPGLKVVQ